MKANHCRSPGGRKMREKREQKKSEGEKRKTDTLRSIPMSDRRLISAPGRDFYRHDSHLGADRCTRGHARTPVRTLVNSQTQRCPSRACDNWRGNEGCDEEWGRTQWWIVWLVNGAAVQAKQTGEDSVLAAVLKLCRVQSR